MFGQKKSSWYYETKCRKCKRNHEWFVSEKDNMDYKGYLTIIFSKLEQPSGYNCICTKNGATVQDIIAYQYNIKE